VLLLSLSCYRRIRQNDKSVFLIRDNEPRRFNEFADYLEITLEITATFPISERSDTSSRIHASRMDLESNRRFRFCHVPR